MKPTKLRYHTAMTAQDRRIEELDRALKIALEEAFPADLNYSDRYKSIRLKAAEDRLVALGMIEPPVQILE